jgi:hypothetical protein
MDTNQDKQQKEDKMLGKKYKGEEKYNVNYFVWGTIDNKTDSFYLNPNELDKFMTKQNFNTYQRSQVEKLSWSRGIEFEKGFTIERRLKPINN